MFQYDFAARAFAQVNLAGRINRSWCTADGWNHSLTEQFRQHTARVQAHQMRHQDAIASQNTWRHTFVHAAGTSAYRLNHVRLSTSTIWAIMPTCMRIATWVHPGPTLFGPENLLERLSSGVPGLLVHHALWAWPYIELFAGRGHLVNTRPQAYGRPVFEDAIGRNGQLLHFGLLGMLLEYPGLAGSGYLLRRQHPSLAAFSLWSACLGRLSLQPIRLATTAACLAATLPIACIIGMTICIGDGLLDITASAADFLLGNTRTQPAPRAFVGALRNAYFFSSLQQAVLTGRVLEDANPADRRRASIRGDVTGQVRKFTKEALMNFQDIDGLPGAEQPAAVVQLRDQIIEELADFCRDVPPKSGLYWGVAELNGFIANTYDDSLCIAVEACQGAQARALNQA